MGNVWNRASVAVCLQCTLRDPISNYIGMPEEKDRDFVVCTMHLSKCSDVRRTEKFGGANGAKRTQKKEYLVAQAATIKVC